jgi:hypothetical protein
MRNLRRCSACEPESRLGDLTLLANARSDLEPIEAYIREIRDLTTALRAELPPRQFRLVWRLCDAVEGLGLAEALLRERRMVELLARHLDNHGPVIRAAARHVLEAELKAGD